MKHLFRIGLAHGALLLIGAAPAASTGVGGEPTLTLSPEPSPEFTEVVSEPIRSQLGLALVEMAYGDPERAAARAQAAAVPERVRIYIDTSGHGRRRASRLRKGARAALNEWNRSVPGSPFEEVSRLSQADVVVRFVDRIQSSGRRLAGKVSWKRTVRKSAGKATFSIRGSVQIANIRPNGRSMTTSEVKRAVAHELGHILGLRDTGDSSKLMGPVSARDTEIGEREKRALEELDRRAQAVMEMHTAVRFRSRVPTVFHFAELR
ncbi:MAG: matrixin family metalloprotease [Armatimonadetes bacterium]|nr:matrixin family metalloprotease [Armatimonadota bacterium]